jgi:hypothetical protein
MIAMYPDYTTASNCLDFFFTDRHTLILAAKITVSKIPKTY